MKFADKRPPLIEIMYFIDQRGPGNTTSEDIIKYAGEIDFLSDQIVEKILKHWEEGHTLADFVSITPGQAKLKQLQNFTKAMSIESMGLSYKGQVCTLSYDAYFNLVDYIELEEARQASSDAKEASDEAFRKSILVSAIIATIGMVLSAGLTRWSVNSSVEEE